MQLQQAPCVYNACLRAQVLWDVVIYVNTMDKLACAHLVSSSRLLAIHRLCRGLVTVIVLKEQQKMALCK